MAAHGDQAPPSCLFFDLRKKPQPGPTRAPCAQQPDPQQRRRGDGHRFGLAEKGNRKDEEQNEIRTHRGIPPFCCVFRHGEII